MKKTLKAIVLSLITTLFISVSAFCDTYDWSRLYDYSDEYSWIKDLADFGTSDSDIIDCIYDSYDESKAKEIIESAKVDSSGSDGSADNSRIEDIEQALSDLRIDIESLKESYDLVDMQNKSISDKLDILILSLADYKQFQVDTLYPNSDIANDSYIKQIADTTCNIYEDSPTEVIKTMNHLMFRNALEEYEDGEVTLSEQIDEMSKNITDSLQATNERTLEEMNETLLKTNKFLSYLMVLLLITLVMIIGLWVGKLVHNILNRNVY